MKRIGPDKIRALLPKLDAKVFSPEVFRQLGVFVVRDAIPAETLGTWQFAWSKFCTDQLFAGRNVN